MMGSAEFANQVVSRTLESNSRGMNGLARAQNNIGLGMVLREVAPIVLDADHPNHDLGKDVQRRALQTVLDQLSDEPNPTEE